MATHENDATRALWRCLDLTLEAYAVTQDCDPEVADLIMSAALAVADRLELSDRVIQLMRDSAIAEVRQNSCDSADAP